MTAGTGPDGDNRLTAEASTVLVGYDYATEKPIRVPDPWREAFAAYEGHSLERST
jgi:acyl-CoA thioesterase FadM